MAVAIEGSDKTKNRVAQYGILFVVLFVVFLWVRGSDWVGNKQIHTLMELAATLLASVVGILALVRYYAKKNSTLLFVGAGFLGTAFLDGYHAIVTSTFFDQLLPSIPASLIPWSWNASRTFLAILMLASWWTWYWERKLDKRGVINAKVVYLLVGAFALLSFSFFTFYSLPEAYYPEFFYGRPGEFIPAVFFLLALGGYLTKAEWRRNEFDHWVVISLIISFMSLVMFMTQSYQLFDMMFDMAHILKGISYICVLVGSLVSMFYLFREAQAGRQALASRNTALKKAQDETKKALTVAETSKHRAEKDQLGAEEKTLEAERLNKLMVGRELKMVELKKEVINLKKRLTSVPKGRNNG